VLHTPDVNVLLTQPEAQALAEQTVRCKPVESQYESLEEKPDQSIKATGVRSQGAPGAVNPLNKGWFWTVCVAGPEQVVSVIKNVSYFMSHVASAVSGEHMSQAATTIATVRAMCDIFRLGKGRSGG